MGYHRRVTLRCLTDDLATDWGSVSQQRAFVTLRSVASSARPDSDVALALDAVPTTTLADHPLVASFYAAFESDDASIQRESVTGLADPYWWKQKVSRWRGAATDASSVGEGEVWLCAGGLRAAGESRDFYATFMESISANGPGAFLPASEDRRVQAIEAKISRRDAWLAQLRLSVLVCLHEISITSEPRSLHVPAPSPSPVTDPLVHVVFELLRVSDGADELAELSLIVSDRDHARPALVDAALDAVRSLIEPVYEAWTVLPGQGGDEIWAVLVSDELITFAEEAVSTGHVPPQLQESMPKLAVRAHYAPKEHIVDASIDGDPVRGLCGTWFVPTANPDELLVCPACQAVHDGLPQ